MPARGAALHVPLRGHRGGLLQAARHRRDARASSCALARERGLPAADRAAVRRRARERDREPPRAAHGAARRRARDAWTAATCCPEVQRNRERMRVFSQAVREGQWKGHTGERFRHVLALGIGGSALGPRLAVEALRGDADGPAGALRRPTSTPPSSTTRCAGLDPASTLVVVASKTFTTAGDDGQRRGGARLARAPRSAPRRSPSTSSPRPPTLRRRAQWGLPECNVFPFADWVGGRFSLWSSVGLPVAIAIGMPRFEQLLAGAHAADLAFRSDPLERNVPALLAALVGVWNRNALGMRDATRCCRMPRACESLPAYLQQLEMESNGKRVDARGQPGRLPRRCPVVWGGTGHAGPARVPPVAAPGHRSPSPATSSSWRAPWARTRAPRDPARARVRAIGGADGGPRHAADPQGLPRRPRRARPTCCRRSTPSTWARCSRSTSTRCSRRASIWGINSFDQWGVELGKTIAGRILPAVRGGEAPLHPATHHLLGVIRKLRRD